MTRNNGNRKRRNARRSDEPTFEMSPKAKREIVAVLLVVMALISTLAFFSVAGPAGGLLNGALGALFGLLKYVFPAALLVLAFYLVFPDRLPLRRITVIGSILLLFGVAAMTDIIRSSGNGGSLYIEEIGSAGGYLGLVLAYPLVSLLGVWGASIIIVSLILTSIVLVSNLSFHEIWERVRYSGLPTFGRSRTEDGDDEKYYEDEDDEEAEEEDEEDEETEDEDDEGKDAVDDEVKVNDYGMGMSAKPKKHYRKIPIPIDLLEHRTSKPTSGDIHGRMMTIRKTLENFGVPVEMGEVSVGPTVTQFTFKPADGVKLSRITSLSNDLALALAAHPIRIEAPIPGKSLVGIEVPNHTVATVTLREILESKEFAQRQSQLTICLGRDVAGKAWIADIAKMPHLLVAGATGSGKTVCLNTIILSLVYQNSPEDLKLLLIDPKRVELPVYNGIPHLLTPAITEVPKIINSFKWAIGEMERRFDQLSKTGCRDLATYNERHPDDKMPYIVLVVDELADLMVASAAEVEGAIIRLAQMARAVGIHLIIATQRPSVDVITGLIKANITSRIAFSVASSMDSRTILDTTGAEKLVGRGDMLFVSAELSKPKRIQCCFVGDRDIKQVVDFVVEKMDEPVEYVEGVTEKKSGSGFGPSGADDDDDELYDEARDTVVRAGKASASYLQRRLKVGYARAARLLDLLEERGIIGPGDGAKPRQILVDGVSDEDGTHFSDEDDE
ncbi:MAG: DNA translocase FtsK [bacterium]